MAPSEMNSCIICTKLSPASELTAPKDIESRTSLLEAATLQQFEAILNLAEDDYAENLVYHRKCRSSFTHKKTLDRLKKKEVEQLTPEHLLVLKMYHWHPVASLMMYVYFATKKANIFLEVSN